ncbi:MAG: hypothetical protein L6V87_06880 [Ruminococcus sp.]|nr:MAG: hypothetical protein L6V87_06880 [Ruminococcus sp.]
MASKCTLEDLKESELELLVPQMVADVLGTSAKTLIQTARNAPDSLGFPVIKIGKTCKISPDGLLLISCRVTYRINPDDFFPFQPIVLRKSAMLASWPGFFCRLFGCGTRRATK